MKCDSQQVEQAVKDYQAGKDCEENFRLIYECCRRRVFSAFNRRNFTPDQCHDLTQEAFSRVYKSIAEFRGEIPFSDWVIRKVAVSVYKDELRRRKAQKRDQPEVSLDGVGDDDEIRALSLESRDPSPLHELLDKELWQRVDEALARLPQQMGSCMKLHLRQGRSAGEIAVILNLSINTVKAHLREGKAKLRADQEFKRYAPSLWKTNLQD